jgi:hypothetical protein
MIAPTDQNGNATGQGRPDDFHILYEWQEGSLPPPYHYEYTITISPTGAAEIVMIPDYPSDETPAWTESFTVDSAQMDALYDTLITNGLLDHNWSAQDDPPVGGSSQSVTITANDQQIEIPSFVLPEQQSSAAAIHAAIEALVPQEIWDRLNAQREQYMEEHPDS